jgi:hypothetical protein
MIDNFQIRLIHNYIDPISSIFLTLGINKFSTEDFYSDISGSSIISTFISSAQIANQVRKLVITELNKTDQADIKPENS